MTPPTPARLPLAPTARPLPRLPDRGRQWLNLGLAVGQVAAIAWQAQSSFGADLSGRGPDAPVVPAFYTFIIWGPIYLSSLAYAVYQFLPAQAGRELHRRVGGWTAAAFGASALWALAAGSPPPLVSWGTVAMIFGMFGGLLGAYLNGVRLEGNRADRWLVVAPLGLYLGYVTLATVANTASSLWQTGLTTPLGLGETPWAALMLGVAGGLASLLAVRTGGRGAYSAAAVWGLVGVTVQNAVVAPQPWVAVAAGASALAVAGSTLWARFARARRGTAAR